MLRPYHMPDDPGPEPQPPEETIMNSNAFHNIANIVMALLALVTAVLTAIGCTTLPNGAMECSQSVLSPEVSAWVLAGLAGLKIVVNLFRDGIGGLFKPQPPVAK